MKNIKLQPWQWGLLTGYSLILGVIIITLVILLKDDNILNPPNTQLSQSQVVMVEGTVIATKRSTFTPTSLPQTSITLQPTQQPTQIPLPTNTPITSNALENANDNAVSMPISTPNVTANATAIDTLPEINNQISPLEDNADLPTATFDAINLVPTASATSDNTTSNTTSNASDTIPNILTQKSLETATITVTPTPQPTETFTVEPTATPTATATATDTATNTATPKPTATPTATETPLPTKTFTVEPTATSTATETPLPTETFTPEPTSASTATSELALDSTPMATSTSTKTPTSTPLPTPTSTATATPTNTSTATFVPTNTSTSTPLPTATSTATETPLPTSTAKSPPIAKNISVQANPLTDGRIGLSWSSIEAEQTYQVYSDMGTGYGVYIYKGNTQETAFLDNVARPGFKYAYKVEIINNNQALIQGIATVLSYDRPAVVTADMVPDAATNLTTHQSNVTVIPAPTALPADALLLGLMSDASYTDEFNTLNVVGEVRNDSNLDVGEVTIGVSFYDATGTFISESHGQTVLKYLAPGERSPFLLSLPRPAAMNNYSVKAVGRPITPQLKPQVIVIKQAAYQDTAGFYHVTGIIQNIGSIPVPRAKVVVTLFGRGGGVINVGFAYPEPKQLNSGEQANFDVVFAYYPKVLNREVIVINE